MIANFLKIIFFCLIIFNQNNVYSQNIKKSFNKEKVADYFSSLVSYNNDESRQFLNSFVSSRLLENSNKEYVSHYLISLVLEGKISKAITKAKIVKEKKINESYESDLLVAINNLKNQDYKLFFSDIDKQSILEKEDELQKIILSSLREFAHLFYYDEIDNKINNNFGHLTIINKAFQKCYLGDKNTTNFFDSAINSEKGDYSRYLFFYINFLISRGEIDKAKVIADKINALSDSLLSIQAKNWVDKEKFDDFNKIFSCKNPQDIIGEFFYLIASLYSGEGDIKKSNFYLKVSNYLNPKFEFNLSLFIENYYKIENFKLSNVYLEKLQKENQIYHWYKLKKKAEIIKNEQGSDSSFDFIYSEFNKIKLPSLRIIFDIANITKNFEKYDLSINHYSKILLNLDQKSLLYADILYRRGSCYERLGEYKKADEDFLKSLEINEDSYTLNYLAYSWLERNHKIELAINMLEKANKKNENDPYIIDSVGWGYYLTQDYIKAEFFLRRAVMLMPNDPIVNDHYGDALWKLGRKLQANYFWKNVLTLENTEDKMKNDINLKLLNGPDKI